MRSRHIIRNFPVLIVEGPDAVGKTTLCRKFQEFAGARYLHLTLRREMHRWQVAGLLRALALSQYAPVVIDRHWPSEMVYAGVYRNGSKLHDEDRGMDELLSWLGIPYVFCHLDSVSQMVNAHTMSSGERPEMYQPDDRIRQVCEGYMQWWYGDDGPWGYDNRLGHCSTIASQGGMYRRKYAMAWNYKESGPVEQFVQMAIGRGERALASWRQRMTTVTQPLDALVVERSGL